MVGEAVRPLYAPSRGGANTSHDAIPYHRMALLLKQWRLSGREVVMQTSERRIRGNPPEGEMRIFGLMVTYPIVFLLLFFSVNGGALLTGGATTSSLQATTDASTTVAGSLFQGVAWAVACVIMASSLGSTFRACLEVKALTLLSLLAPVSALWSQQPVGSLRRGIFLVLGTLFAVYLVRTFEAVEIAQMLVLTGVLIGLIAIAVSIGDPAIGRDVRNGGAWQGVFGAKNGCGEYMLFLLSPAICFRFSQRNMRLLCYALYFVAAVLIIMSRAKTAWVLCPAFIVFIAWLSQLRRISSKSARFIVFATVILVGIIGIGLPLAAGNILQLLGKESTLSGRIPLWAGVLHSISKRPLLGYGYDAFWHQGLQGEVLSIFTIAHFEVFQAQNGFLEVWLELGLAGLLLMLLTLFQAVRDSITCFRYGDHSSTRWYIGMIVLTVIYNMDESFLALSSALPWFLYIIACAGLAREARKVRSPDRLRDLHPAPALN
jgi:exopolysaccharide production protein ExoQ